MSLMLDSTLIKGFQLKITASLTIESGDASGQTSSTATTHKGFKAKKFTVSLQIPYDQETLLTNLRELAEATGKGNKPKVYLATNNTINCFGVKQVQFNDTLSAREDDNVNFWQVQFNLLEYISNPERTEARTNKNASDSSNPTLPGVPINEADKGDELTEVEQKIKGFDDWLGGTK